MMRLAALFWFAVAAVVALFLFHVKYEVQHLEERLEQAHNQISREQEAIHILQAEWSHLNRPSRIAQLAERHLGLQPAETRQLASLEVIPERPPSAGPPDPDMPEAEGPDDQPDSPKSTDEDKNGTALAAVEAPAPVPAVKPAHLRRHGLPAAVRTTLASIGVRE